MSNNYWEDDDDLDIEESAPLDSNDLVKKLRKAKRADEKRIKELTEQLEGFSKSQREQIVKSVLENKGVNPKAARLILNELSDVNEESVNNWLDDNGDLFGIQQQPQPVNTIDRAALRQQDIVTNAATTPDRSEDTWNRIQNAQSAEDIINMIHSGEF